MEKIVPQTHVVRFGHFELDLRAGELRNEGVRIRLQDQPLQVLAMLIERPDQIVTREELRNKLWPADTFVDFDHSLNRAVNKLREALDDSAEHSQFIETVPRRGYRFLVPVTCDSENFSVQASIAVLPFLNLSGDPQNEYFCDGISEEIIGALSCISNLRVVARTSSFAFKAQHLDLRTVGQQLNVRTILEGSVRRSGDRVRITAQLVNAADGYHLWSERYDRKMTDIFAIQEEIAISIAQHLELTLDVARQSFFKAGTRSLEAFKFYAQGRSLFFLRGSHLLSAVEYFRKSVSIDPNYALAWSGLADTFNMMAFYGVAEPGDSLPRAREAAQKAIELDPSLAEAHTSLALSHLFHDWDWVSAEREFLRSFELKSQNSLARSWFGMYYLQWAAGRFEEGLAQAQQAVQIDPLSAWSRGILALTYLLIDPAKCIETALKTLQIEPNSYLCRWAQMTGLNAAERGELAVKMFGRPVWVMASLARTYAHLGRADQSKMLYMELRWRAKREYVG